MAAALGNGALVSRLSFGATVSGLPSAARTSAADDNCSMRAPRSARCKHGA
jgi:hypothetical protein